MVKNEGLDGVRDGDSNSREILPYELWLNLEGCTLRSPAGFLVTKVAAPGEAE